MSVYLKQFNNHQEYEQYINGSGAILPNVSICVDTPNEALYNPYCEETSVYEVVGVPTYPSEIKDNVASFNITFDYKKIDTNKKCQQTVTEDSDSITIECGQNNSTNDRIVSGTVDYYGTSISYQLTQKGKPIIDGHEYVDLGLPSGTKWSKMNIDVTSETYVGNYYKYGQGSSKYSKSQTDYSGTTNPLPRSVDTAAKVWGGQWHMPTKAQFEELTANTTYSYDGNGVKFTASNGNYIFFPFGGIYTANGSMTDYGTNGYYWSSTPNGKGYAYSFRVGNNFIKYVDSRGTNYGCNVRGVVG